MAEIPQSDRRGRAAATLSLLVMLVIVLSILAIIVGLIWWAGRSVGALPVSIVLAALILAVPLWRIGGTFRYAAQVATEQARDDEDDDQDEEEDDDEDDRPRFRPGRPRRRS